MNLLRAPDGDGTSSYIMVMFPTWGIPHSLELGCRDVSLGGESFVLQTTNMKIFMRGSLIIVLDENGGPYQNDQRLDYLYEISYYYDKASKRTRQHSRYLGKAVEG